MTQHKNINHLSPIDRLMAGLANAKRREIVRTLLKGEVSVGTLAKLVSLSESSLSQHLRKLRDFQIVTTRRDAQTIYYFCDHPDVVRLMAEIEAVSQGILPVDHVALISTLQKLTSNTGRDHRTGEEFVHGHGSQEVVGTLRAALVALQGIPPVDHVELSAAVSGVLAERRRQVVV